MAHALPRAAGRTIAGRLYRMDVEETTDRHSRQRSCTGPRRRARTLSRTGAQGDWPMIWACVLVTAAALFYIFHVPDAVSAGPTKTRINYLRERKEVIYENLRDLNFDYKAGKLPESDYQTMRSSLEEEAAAVLAEISRLESGASSREDRANEERA